MQCYDIRDTQYTLLILLEPYAPESMQHHKPCVWVTFSISKNNVWLAIQLLAVVHLLWLFTRRANIKNYSVLAMAIFYDVQSQNMGTSRQYFR